MSRARKIPSTNTSRIWTDDELRAEKAGLRADYEALLATLGPEDIEDRQLLTAAWREVEALHKHSQRQQRQIAEMKAATAALKARYEWREARRMGLGQPMLKAVQ